MGLHLRPHHRILGYTLLLTGSVLLAGSIATAEELAAARLEVTFLANEGFLLQCGDRKVLIDAFVQEPYSVYGAVPDEVFTQMVAGQPPFDGIDLALVSHIHRDHFQPAAATEFLRRQPQAKLVSSGEVGESLRAATTQHGFSDRVIERWPEPGAQLVFEDAGIRVDFLRLRHGGTRHHDRHNLGHVIHLCGRKVAHFGDAEENPAHFAPYAAALANLDVVLLPAWFYETATGRETIDTYLRADLTVAAHIQPGQLERLVTAFRREFPKVRIFTRALESVVIE